MSRALRLLDRRFTGVSEDGGDDDGKHEGSEKWRRGEGR
jgi:hypothetical protein